MNNEPVTKYLVLLAQHHIGLDPDFKNLIGNDNDSNDNQGFCGCSHSSDAINANKNKKMIGHLRPTIFLLFYFIGF
jgi:hypothetical protein